MRPRPLVPRQRAPGDDRDPQLPRRRRGRRPGREPARDHRARTRSAIIVADDASRPRARRRAAGDRGDPRSSRARTTRGFAANVNRGLAAADPEPRRRAAQLRHDRAAGLAGEPAVRHQRARTDVGDRRRQAALPRRPDPVRAARCATSARRSGSTTATASAAANFGPGQRRRSRSLAVSGACMYLTRERSTRSAASTRRYPMAYEDVDLCLRAWQAGFRVLYWPDRRADAPGVGHARHATSASASATSQRVFWERWGDFFDARDVRTADGRAARRLRDRGHRRRRRPPRHLRAPQPAARARPRGRAVDARRAARLVRAATCRCAPSRTTSELVEALAPMDAIKVATWWNTAAPVWRASVLHGIPVYFVQDIETSYYAEQPAAAGRRAGLLPPRVPLHDDLLLEPRPAARARARRGADPAGDRPRELPAAARRRRAAATCCWRSGAPTR